MNTNREELLSILNDSTLEDFSNNILYLTAITELTFLSCEMCIHPLFFLKSTILLKFSFLSITRTGKKVFL